MKNKSVGLEIALTRDNQDYLQNSWLTSCKNYIYIYTNAQMKRYALMVQLTRFILVLCQSGIPARIRQIRNKLNAN